MKYLSLTLVLVCLSLQLGVSQVKKQYQDRKNAETTVVVKEDKVKDVDILNSQFNLNDIGMGEVIMIKTENLKPKGAPTKKPAVKKPLPEAPQVVKTTPAPKKKVVVEKTKPAREVAAQPQAQSKRKISSGNNVYSNLKRKNKRVRLKKRKKTRKNKRRSCYRF